jgi:hypothetical protein
VKQKSLHIREKDENEDEEGEGGREKVKLLYDGYVQKMSIIRNKFVNCGLLSLTFLYLLSSIGENIYSV